MARVCDRLFRLGGAIEAEVELSFVVVHNSADFSSYVCFLSVLSRVKYLDQVLNGGSAFKVEFL
jgi:hypothetical protein